MKKAFFSSFHSLLQCSWMSAYRRTVFTLRELSYNLNFCSLLSPSLSHNALFSILFGTLLFTRGRATLSRRRQARPAYFVLIVLCVARSSTSRARARRSFVRDFGFGARVTAGSRFRSRVISERFIWCDNDRSSGDLYRLRVSFFS